MVRSNFKNLTFVSSFATVLILQVHLSAHVQDKQIETIDSVPRHRLVTDREFFELLDRSDSDLGAAISSAAAGDTTKALLELADYLRQRKSPRYFFKSADVKQRTRAFARAYPEAVSQIESSTADFIRTYGVDLDWELLGKDLLGRRHTANTVRFLARQALATNMAVMQFVSGGEPDYADFILRQARDFVKDYEAGKTESGANDVFERYYAGHRARNWLFAQQLLLGSSRYSWQDQIFMLKVFLLHGARLYDDCKKFHWGNHQLHGLEGLFEITLMFPEFEVMRFWHQRAVEGILEHLEKEIKPDGFQFERASHYFKLDILNYFRVFRLAQLNGVALPEVFRTRFRKMFDAIVALAKPDKTLPVLQDAQAVYAPQNVQLSSELKETANGKRESNDIAELADLKESLFMSLGAVLFNDPTYKFFGADRLPAALFWFLDEGAGQRYEGIGSKPPGFHSIALRESNYYVMRSGWSHNDLYLIIDGGLAKYKPDHTHGGILGLIAYAFGDDILPNYRVRYSEPSYRTLKNSLAKNVALVDHQLQGRGWIDNKAQTGFGIWQALPKPTVHEWLGGEKIDYFSGSHDGFVSNGVQYTRSILFLKPHGWIVMDEFKGDRPHSLQQIWQGDFQFGPKQNGVVSKGQHSVLSIQQADPAVLEIEHKEIYSKKYVQFEKRGVETYTFTTLVQPMVKPVIAGQLRRFDRPEFSQISVTENDRRDLVFLRGDRDLNRSRIQSDAQFAVLRFAADSLYAVLLHEGTRLETEGLAVQTQSPASVELVRQPSGDWHSNVLKGEDQKISITTLAATN